MEEFYNFFTPEISLIFCKNDCGYFIVHLIKKMGRIVGVDHTWLKHI